MGRGVPALVIGVDAKVQAHQFVESRIIVPEHATEVAGIIERRVLLDDAVEVDVAIDGRGDLGYHREHVEDVL